MNDERDCSCDRPAPRRNNRNVVSRGLAQLVATPIREGRGFRVYELLPPTTFSWTNVRGSTRLEHIVSALAPVTDAPEGIAIVRIHDNSIGVDALATVGFELVTPTNEDPGTTFDWVLSMGDVRIDAASGEQNCLVQRLRCDAGSHVRARVSLDQARTPLASAVTLSVELVLRYEADDEGEQTCARGC